MNKICQYTIDQYILKLTEFHGNLAPGLLIGGYMVDAAAKRLAGVELVDAICESNSCLLDAVQILTPCTVGNGWLKIVNTGRFALALYDKKSGSGFRVSLDTSKLDKYPEIKKWFLRLVPKHEQDSSVLIREIRAAGQDLLTITPITIAPALLGKQEPPPIVICESCGEPFPQNGCTLCPACQGMNIYV